MRWVLLMGCIIATGSSAMDVDELVRVLQLGQRNLLLEQFPAHREIIEKFTR